MINPSRYERFIGTLLCGSIGDALGSINQGKSHDDILKTGIETYKSYPGSYSTGVELALTLAQYLTRCNKDLDGNFPITGNKKMVEDVHSLYTETIKTSNKFYPPDIKDILSSSNPYMHPGKSNNGDAITRISSMALTYFETDTDLYENIKNVLYYTHGDNKDAIDTAFIHTKLVQTLVFERRKSAEELYPYTLYLSSKQQNKNLHALLTIINPENKNHFITYNWDITRALYGFNLYQTEAIDCFICALTCFLYNFDNPKNAIFSAIMCGGNTSVITKLVGDYTGALYGTRWMPAEWLHLENKQTLINTAATLYLQYPRDKHGWSFVFSESIPNTSDVTNFVDEEGFTGLSESHGLC
jgi:ADP-ribosylglycohydrolase